MANKFFAVFLVCMVVFTALHVEAADMDEYRSCFDTCHKECFQDGKGQGYTFCEMKCDSECSAKAVKDKLDSLTS